MSRLSVLFCIVLAVFLCSYAQCNDETNINFYFADMLAGANGPSGPPPNGGGDYSYNNASGDAFDVEQTIYGLFAVNEQASNDLSANVNYNTYGPYVTPYVTSNIMLSSINAIIDNGAPTNYAGVQGVVNYFNDLSTSRSSSRQYLTNLVYNFGDVNCPTETVTVNANFFGIESLNSNSSYQTFYGTRVYMLVRSPSSMYGWAISSLVATRYITRPSPDYSAYFAMQAQAAALALIELNDEAGNGMSVSESMVSPYVTSSFSVTANVPAPNTVYSSGPSAFAAFLANISASRVASQTQLSNFQYTFNADQSVVVIRAKATGYEFLSNGSADTFYGTRNFSVVRGDDGVWRVDTLTFIRTASFPAVNGTQYMQ